MDTKPDPIHKLPRFSLYLWLALGMTLILVAGFAAYVSAEKNIDLVNDQRNELHLLADQMRQSSDDLSRMVRTYVVTGEPIYKRHYQEILDIRNGKAPRPVDYHNVYWDLVLTDDVRPRPLGEAVPLLDLMRRHGFSEEEMAMLAEAKANSDALTHIELKAMALIEATTPTSAENRDRAIRMLHDDAYHRSKISVMHPINEFFRLSEQRTRHEVQKAINEARHARTVFLVLGLLLFLLLWMARRSLRVILGGAVYEVHTHIARLGKGDFSTPIPVPGELRNSVLGWLSETQASLARLDIQRRNAEEKSQRLTRMHAALGQCNQVIARCTDETGLMNQVCRVVVNLGGMKMAWVGKPDESGQQIRPVASFGDSTAYVQDLQIALDANNPYGRGPTGCAFRENRPVWCHDFANDPATAPWHERGRPMGWVASAALPLCLDGQVAAILTLYTDTPQAFDEDVQDLLLKLCTDIEYALNRLERDAQRRQAEERIQYLAHFDPLTGLPNRSLLDDRVRYAIGLAQRSKTPVTLMFLDLDHFKDINDTLGHTIGDALLVEVARRLRLILRAEDTVSRLGGDEFIFLLHGVDAHGAALVAQKILKTVAEPYRIEQYDLNVTGSIGITLYPNDGCELETLFRNADTAMYRVKQEGRHGYRFFTSEMQTHSARHLQLVSALRLALERDQFRVHYQPQISMRDGSLVGAEALLRWTHPEMGAVSPAEFIPAAEDSGLILPIGEWVLRHAVRQARHWIRDGMTPLVMAVNLSAVQFRHPDLPALVSRILDEEGLAPEYLELELTEGVAMHDPQSAIAMMNNLHERGVRMSIDDFGTGYSSLSQLKKFKVYKLKIDQSFVRDISTDPEDKAIVSAIINMAKSLGLQTIAEGVETAGQLAFLREQGCDEMQGYYFGRPMPAEQFEAFSREKIRPT